VVSKNLTFLLIVIVMLVIGVLVGYGLGGGKVVTVTTTIPSPITIYTPYPTTVTTTITYTPTSTERFIEASPGQVVTLGPWRLAVLDAKKAVYVKTIVLGTWSYYKAPEGMKIIIITVRVENTGTDLRYPFGVGDISTPTLVTDANRSYDYTSTYQLKYIYSYEVTKEIEQSAVEYRELDIFAKVAPGTYIEGDFMYLIPTTEKPIELVMTYWPSLFEQKTTVIIRLS
jgi:hypothetical protein